MPKLSKVHLLPADAKLKLDNLLQDTKGGDVRWVSTQMANLGYSISKSTISRYSIQQRNPLTEENFEHKATGEIINLRLSAYQLSALVLDSSDHDLICRHANQILLWAAQ